MTSDTENTPTSAKRSLAVFADWVGKFAGFLQQRITAARLESIFGFMKKLSVAVMTLIIAILPIIGATFALQVKDGYPLWVTLGASVALAFLQYASLGFLTALEKLLHNSAAPLTTRAIAQSIGVVVIAVALGLGVSAFMNTGVFVVVRLIMAAGLFLLGCVYMTPSLTRVEVCAENSPGKDLVGISSLILNGLVVAFPLIYAASGIAAIVLLLGGFFDKNILMQISAVTLALETGLLPIAFYLTYIAYYLLIDLIKAVLAIPDIGKK